MKIIKSYMDVLKQYIINPRNRKYKISLLSGLIIGCIGLTFVLSSKATDQEDIQEGIASQIIRFHVLANSDSKEDQEIKIKVKQHLIDVLEPILKDSTNIDDTRKILQENLSYIEEEAVKKLEEMGDNHKVKAYLTQSYFPIKTYGDCTFPAGEYEALRIEIGSAKGKNWWCVLYPNLCFIDATHAVVPEEQKEELKELLTEEEYDSILGNVKIKLRFRLFDDILGR